MDDKVLAACAAFLDRDEAEVAELHETAELLPALLAGIGLALRAPRTTGEPRVIALIDALGDVFGSGPIKTHEILAVIHGDFGNRPALRSAITDLVGSTHDGQRLGLALRRICADGGLGSRWCLTAPTKEGGQRVWCVSGGLR